MRRITTPRLAAASHTEHVLSVPCLLQIDTWSAGCVITEMLLGHPLFPGESGVDQLVEIIKVLSLLASTLPLMSRLHSRCLGRQPGSRSRR